MANKTNTSRNREIFGSWLWLLYFAVFSNVVPPGLPYPCSPVSLHSSRGKSFTKRRKQEKETELKLQKCASPGLWKLRPSVC